MAAPDPLALSAVHAAWTGAFASTSAAVVALGIAVFGAWREGRRRRDDVRDQKTAFCFAMVGAMEMIKPIVVAAETERDGAFDRRRFLGMIDHAQGIAEAGLAIQVFDMQMLRDAYQLKGALNYLRALPEDHPGAIPHAAIRDVLGPSLDGLLEGDDRFFARLPPISTLQGINGRTVVERRGD